MLEVRVGLIIWYNDNSFELWEAHSLEVVRGERERALCCGLASISCVMRWYFFPLSLPPHPSVCICACFSVGFLIPQYDGLLMFVLQIDMVNDTVIRRGSRRVSFTLRKVSVF